MQGVPPGDPAWIAVCVAQGVGRRTGGVRSHAKAAGGRNLPCMAAEEINAARCVCKVCV